MLLLIFCAGEQRYGLDSRRIIEIVPRVSLKPVPHAPAYVAGLFNYRGHIVPVIDLTAVIADTPARDLLSTRIVLLEYEGVSGEQHILGLMAEQVTETLDCREEDFNPPGIVTSESRYLGDVFVDEEGMIQRIQIEKILPDSLKKSLFAVVGEEQEADELSDS